MSLLYIVDIIKMLYTLLCYASSLFSFLFNTLWLCFTLTNAGIPWISLLVLIICIASKFAKLTPPKKTNVCQLLGEYSSAVSDDSIVHNYYWPIANRGSSFDAPENSAAALKKVNKLLNEK